MSRTYECVVQPNAGQNMRQDTGQNISTNNRVEFEDKDCKEYSEVTLTMEKVLNGSGNEVTRYKWVGMKCRNRKENKKLQLRIACSKYWDV